MDWIDKMLKIPFILTIKCRPKPALYHIQFIYSVQPLFNPSSQELKRQGLRHQHREAKT